jgi:hypothetical protein
VIRGKSLAGVEHEYFKYYDAKGTKLLEREVVIVKAKPIFVFSEGCGCKKKHFEEFLEADILTVRNSYLSKSRRDRHKFAVQFIKKSSVNERFVLDDEKRKNAKQEHRSHWMFPSTKGGEIPVHKGVCRVGVSQMFSCNVSTLRAYSSNPDPSKKITGRKRKLDAFNLVVDFLSDLPTHQSHYREAEAPHKVYLHDRGLNVSSLFAEYSRRNSANSASKIAERTCRNIFDTEFNIGFRQTEQDKCQEWI